MTVGDTSLIARRLSRRSTRALWIRNSVRTACLALAAVALIAVGSSYDLYVFGTCMLAAVSAIALNLLIGTAGQISLGTVAFLGLGGFMTAALLRAGVPFGVALLVIAIAAAVGGVIIGLPSLRIRGLYLALATLGAYFVVIYIGQRYQNAVAGPAGFVLSPLFRHASFTTQQRYWTGMLTAIVAVTAVGTDRLVAGRIGRAFRMVRDEETAAPALGIDVTKYKLAAFVISSVVTAIAGGISAVFVGDVSTDSYSVTLVISYLAMVLIGGFDSVTGAIVGAVVVTMLPIVVLRVVTAAAGAQYALLHGTEVSGFIYGLVIVVLASRAPGGLSALTEAVWVSQRRRFLRSRRSVRSAVEKTAA